MSMEQRLFVYGSLRPGGRNQHALAGIEGSWQRGWVRGRLLEGGWGAAMGYPAIRLDDSAEAVPGDVLTSSRLDEHWDRLDEFEGDEYRRVLATVRLQDEATVQAFVYVLRE